MTQRLKITIQDGKKKPKVVLDEEVVDATIKWDRDYQEIRSNPALATAMAGAPPEAIMDLPGEQVAIMTRGYDIEVTYKLRFRVPKFSLSGFRDAP